MTRHPPDCFRNGMCSSSQMSSKRQSSSLQHQSCVTWCSQQKVPQEVILMRQQVSCTCFASLQALAIIAVNSLFSWLKLGNKHLWDHFLLDFISLFCVSLKVVLFLGHMNNITKCLPVPVVIQTWKVFNLSVNSCDSLSSAYDQEMASLLLLIHLLPPSPGGQKSPKISACDAVERLVVFHKVIILLRLLE